MSEISPLPQQWRRRMAGRDPEEGGRASTPLELLFDLTFVVAVALAAAQLHHALAEETRPTRWRVTRRTPTTCPTGS